MRRLHLRRPRRTSASSVWPAQLWPDAVRVGPRHLACGDGFSASLVILDYPSNLPLGWIEPLVAPQAHAQISIHLDTVTNEVALGKLRRRQARMEANRRYNAAHDRLEDPKLEAAATDTADLVDRLVRGQTRMHPMSVYVTVHAPDRHALDLAVARLRSAATAQLMDMRPLTERQLPGITATAPLGVDGPGCVKTVDTDVAASAFPFASPDVSMPDEEAYAAFYGFNLASGAPLVWSRWAQDNHNTVIIGRSGVGKSYMVKTLLLRELYQGIEATVIDPEGEYRALAEHVGGTVTAPGTGSAINPLALPVEPESDALTRRKMFAGTVVETALGEELTAAEVACVDAAVTRVYAEAGISADQATWDRRPPTMADLLTALESSAAETGPSLAARLAPYISGGLSSLLAGSESAPARERPHLEVFDLSGVADELMPLTTLVVLDGIWRNLRSDGKRRTVTVDEAWLLLSSGAGAKFLSRVAKTARKRNAGLTTVTQDVSDMLGSELGHTVIANASTQIVMRQAPQSVALVAEAFGLSAAERDLANTARRGEALLLAGERRAAFTSLASPEEHRLCLTGLSAERSRS